MKTTYKKIIILILAITLLMGHVLPLISNADTTYTIHFDTAGGTIIDDVVLKEGQTLYLLDKVPENPTKEGYTFFGWYYSDTFELWEQCWDLENTDFYEDTTLYALFIANENVISNINVTLKAPVAGTVIVEEEVYDEEYDEYSYFQKPIPEVTPVDADAPYEISYCAWITTEGEEFKNFYGEIKEDTDYLADICIYLEDEGPYRFSPDCTIKVNGADPIEIGDMMDTWIGFVGKVRSTTEQVDSGSEVTNEVNNVEENTTVEGDVSSQIVFVEPEENTTIDVAAAEAVEKMVEDIVEGKNVEGIDEELKEKIQNAIQQDQPITVEVSVTEVVAEDVEEDAKKVEGELKGDAKLATLYNINVVINIDGEAAGNVTKTAQELDVVLPIPENLPEVPTGYTRVFTIYKVHNGVATKLDTTKSGDKLSAKSSEFSTYAVTYEDVKEIEAKGSNPATGDQILLYISLTTISLIGITVITLIKKH